MSAKLVYSLSYDKQNLKKQNGCMKGLLHFFDPHHFINKTHRRLPLPQAPDENKLQERTLNSVSKKSQEKHRYVVKDKQESPIESSRLSISSTTSTTISSSEYDWASKPEDSPFAEPICNDRRKSGDFRESHSHSSPAQVSHNNHKHIRETPSTCASPTPRKAAIYELRHMDSSRPDSPRVSALNESFRSISSNHSAPVLTPRNKDLARLSYDGRETRDSIMSTSKIKDLPRLSLDSKQRTMRGSVHVSKDDLVLHDLKRENAPQEPASCRTPSNIVAKLMGLEEIPDYRPSSTSRRENGESRIIRSPDVFSRSTRAMDESKVDLVLQSPRSNLKESRGSRLNKVKTGKQEAEAELESIKHPLTIYGAIEKRLADIDFQKSGKDLRALKQILESMHREKNKLEINQSSQWTSQKSNNSSIHITPKEGPTKTTPPKVKGVKSSKVTNPSKIVKDSRKETTHNVQDVPLTRLQRLRIVHSEDGTRASVQKKMANNHKESHHIMYKYSRERTPRPIRTSKPPKGSARIPDHKNSRVKHRLSQNQNLAPNTSLLQEKNYQSGEFSNDSTFLSQQQNSNLMTCQEQVRENKNEEGTQGDMAFEELTITVREQPSPVSVLDASFYDDESPSPVKKKPTAFRDYETSTTYTEAEWKGIDPSYFADSMRPGFSYQSENYQKLESAPPILKFSSYQRGTLRNITPNYDEVNLEKSYVSEILSASGILNGLDHKDYHRIHHSQEAINPKLFYTLEQTKGSSSLRDKRGRHKRRLLFDAVNEILSQKLTQPRPLLKQQSGLMTQGPRLLQDILRELDQLQPISMPDNLDDEEDFLATIIEKDLTQRSANWTDFSREIPALVLDIERLVFKDLIVELVHDNTKVQVQKHSKQ